MINTIYYSTCAGQALNYCGIFFFIFDIDTWTMIYILLVSVTSPVDIVYLIMSYRWLFSHFSVLHDVTKY